MATYAIGDIQGCFKELTALLTLIQFNPQQDILWFAGDLINRGPQSLDVLRFIKSLGDQHIAVLGNHDLHFLAVAFGATHQRDKDTLTEILNAPDRDELVDWLRHLPLIHVDAAKNTILVHAGLAPSWDIHTAKTLSDEVANALQSDKADEFLHQMYGNQPDLWNANLTGMARLRCITNYCTRMRFCTADGRLDLSYKGTLADKPAELIPWFEIKERKNADATIFFGHWAALLGETHTPRVFALDTGCVWGNQLTAMRLEDHKRFSVPCGKGLQIGMDKD